MGIEAAVVEPGTVTLAGGPHCGAPVTVSVDEDMLAAAVTSMDPETQYAHLVAKLTRNPADGSGTRDYAIRLYHKKDPAELAGAFEKRLRRRYGKRRRARQHVKAFAKELAAREGTRVSNVVVLWLGSVSMVGVEKGVVEGRYDRLAWVVTFAEVMGRYDHHAHIKLLVQDPTLAPPERFFLWTLGVHVVDDPDVFDLVNERSMVVVFGDGGGGGGYWASMAKRVWPAAILAERDCVEPVARTGVKEGDNVVGEGSILTTAGGDEDAGAGGRGEGAEWAWPEEIDRERVKPATGGEKDGSSGDGSARGPDMEWVQEFLETYDRAPPPAGVEQWGDVVLLLRNGESPRKALESLDDNHAKLINERAGNRDAIYRMDGPDAETGWVSVPL